MAIRHVTLADVAARSGVSPATVSRVLSTERGFRPATRARVLAAAQELDYRPSAVARALKRRMTHTIGLVVTDIENPFYPQIVRAVEDAAHDRGYALLLCNAADDAARELAYLNLLLERRVDVILGASSRATRRHAQVLRTAPVPVVLLNSAAPGSGLPAVDGDHRRGARLAAEHLLRLGHTVIGHISAPDTNAAARDRLTGVHDAIRAAARRRHAGSGGIPAVRLEVAIGDGHVAGGELAARALLAVPGLTGIACYNDLTAIGALRAVRAFGRRVPDDVSIVGFDDIDLAAWTDPPLTTVRQPTTEMSRWAVERLAEAISESRPVTSAARTLHLRPELVERLSTGPPPG